MNNSKLQWKKLSNTSPYQILFDKDNQLFLQNILSHKITEFEVDNLPSHYIISFIQVLQNYIYYFIENKNQNKNILTQNNGNTDNSNLDEIILLKNEQIEKLNKKLLEYQEVLVKKDKLLNDSNKKLFSLYNQYCKLQKDYKFKMNKYKNEMKENEDNYKEMNDKLINTFQYLNGLYIISNDENDTTFKSIRQNPRYINRGSHKLNTIGTFNHESNRIRGEGVRRGFSSRFSNKVLHKVNTEQNSTDRNKIKSFKKEYHF